MIRIKYTAYTHSDFLSKIENTAGRMQQCINKIKDKEIRDLDRKRLK